MNHIHTLMNAHLDQPSIVTIGVFDGVHLGHQHLVRQLVSAARTSGRLAVVLTLFPHPDVILHGLSGRYYLTTPNQKASLLGDLGVDVVVTHPFDESVRQIRAAEFVEQLLDHLKMQQLWVTADFALGYKREGNFAYLSELGRLKGFDVSSVDLRQSEDHKVVSSTAIREALRNSELVQVQRWLGRYYAVSGPVVHGDHRGRTIGFPTANIDVWSEQALPSNGVYACWATLQSTNGIERLMSVVNIGERPTFNGTGIRIEAHLLDFSRDIYGQTLSLEFVARLRGEQKFNGLPALIEQITQDTQQGRTILMNS